MSDETKEQVKMFKCKAKVWHHGFDMKTMQPMTRYHEKVIEIPESTMPRDFSLRVMNCTIRNEHDLKEEFDYEWKWGVGDSLRKAVYAQVGEDFHRGCVRFLLEILDGIYLSFTDLFGKYHNTFCYENEIGPL